MTLAKEAGRLTAYLHFLVGSPEVNPPVLSPACNRPPASAPPHPLFQWITQTFPAKLPSPDSLFDTSLYSNKHFLETGRSLQRENSFLIADPHLYFLFSKSNPRTQEAHPHICSRSSAVTFPLCPIPSRVSRSWWNTLLSSSCETQPPFLAYSHS